MNSVDSFTSQAGSCRSVEIFIASHMLREETTGGFAANFSLIFSRAGADSIRLFSINYDRLSFNWVWNIYANH